jgi:hypothetical protein
VAAAERIRAGELGEVQLFRTSLRDMDPTDPAFLAHSGGATGEAHCDMAADDWSVTCRIVGDRGSATAVNFVLPNATTGSS